MWRPATAEDDPAIIELSTALFTEDPGSHAVPQANTERTLAELRNSPWRGSAMALELGQQVQGYALLIAFWSNEMGGQVCIVDELYVAPAARGAGHASQLFDALKRGRDAGFGPLVALALETTPHNDRARRFYTRLGFRPSNGTLRLRLAAASCACC